MTGQIKLYLKIHFKPSSYKLRVHYTYILPTFYSGSRELKDMVILTVSYYKTNFAFVYVIINSIIQYHPYVINSLLPPQIVDKQLHDNHRRPNSAEYNSLIKPI